jgi:exopolysaccharide/PEP-CTERM locus tyrosine autokinase
MSKIQEALRKLQKAPSAADKPDTRHGKRSKMPESVIPIVRSKVLPAGVERHHLDEKELIHGGLLAPLDQAIPVSDEFRRIKRPLLDNVTKRCKGAKDHINTIMVASAMPGAGKTFCAVNLAASISLERELNVLLIDADVAKPHISRACHMEDRIGLIDLLEDESIPIEDALVRTDLNDIQILPAGRRHAQSTELLASNRMEAVIHELATRYPDRIVVVDSPPLLITSEAQALAQQVGQIALVIECGKSGHQDIHAVVESLDQDKPINVILNKSVYSQSGGYYGGGYGYYGFNDDE